jgi:2-polyprenyl-3-methyl-5-hydroxy-6-metoxy-1,4-benzoquinol methylase
MLRADLYKANHAFGVDPARREAYSLRQARYDAAAEDIDKWAGMAASEGKTLSVLDVGCKTGTLLRHLEHRPHFSSIRLSGTDISTYDLYRKDLYQEVFVSDLMAGQVEVPSNAYDVVVCEQVLEHLERLDLAIASLERVLKPGGRLIVGVPIFVSLLAFLRRTYVAATLIVDPAKKWSHIQSFSLRTFRRIMKQHSTLRYVKVRGFRIASEGLLMPLENYRWWWKLNRRIGEAIPFACIEVQAIFSKNPGGG